MMRSGVHLGLLASLIHNLQGLMQDCPSNYFLKIHKVCLQAPLYDFLSAEMQAILEHLLGKLYRICCVCDTGRLKGSMTGLTMFFYAGGDAGSA